ncbi:MAG: tetratricopeptide repeat protein [Thermodesulfobacteriota bacterium]|nr:tetratricopeptide repeat protein [Thermodesulfobacteriota bacterium]
MEAEKILSEMIQSNPDSALAYAGFGRLLYKKGYINNDNYKKEFLDQAHECFAKALSLDPKLFDAYHYGAYSYIFSRDLKKAGEMAKKARELEPDSAKVCLLSADIALRDKRDEEAVNWAKSALSKTKDKKISVDAFYLLTRAYRRQKKTGPAEEAYLKIIELDPDSPWAMSNYSSFLSYHKADYDKAIEYGEKALELMDFGMGRHVLGKAYHGKASELLWKDNQVDESMKYFLLALKHYPANAEALYGLGVCLFKKGHDNKDAARLLEAEKALVEAVRLDPEHKEAREKLMEAELVLRAMKK